jgi:uncharacterized protein (TIGR03435 family)
MFFQTIPTYSLVAFPHERCYRHVGNPNERIGADEMRILWLFVAVAVAVTPLMSQSQPATKKSFAVASVKSITQRGRASMTTDGGRFNAPIANLWTLLRWAYRPPAGGPIFYNEYQVVGAPNWIQSARFSVEGKAEDEARQVPAEEMQLMLQSLLEDRFQLKVHRETRQMPLYELVIGKSGLKMKLSDDQTPPEPAQRGQRGQRGQDSGPVRGRTLVNIAGSSTPGFFSVKMSGTGISLPVLVNRLQEAADRPLIDKTNLSGLYDFSLQFEIAAGPNGGEPTDADSFAAMVTAIQEHLGLKLESAKGPSNVLVIDSVQKPAEN